MTRDLKLALRLTADGKGFVGEVRVAGQELDRFAGATRKTRHATDELGSSFQRTHNRLLGYAAGYLTFTQALSATRALVRHADAYTEINNRLRLVTESEAGLVRVRGELFDISQRTRTAFETNATLYSRLSLAAASLGRSETEVLQVTELLNKQLAIGGSTGAEAANGLIQFAQGIASGRLQGDELRSVLENLLGVQ